MKRTVLMLAAFFGFDTAHAAEIQIFTTEAPPYNMTEGGKIVGKSSEVVRKILDKAKVEYKIMSVPWIRALDSVQSDKNACIYGIAMNDERKPQYEWIAPILKTEWVLMAKADNMETIKSLEDVKGKVIGAKSEDSIAIFLEGKGEKVDAINNSELNLKKLVEGRIDYWGISNLAAAYMAEKSGLSDKIKEVFSFNASYVYLACNKGLDADVISALKQAGATEGVQR